MAALLAVAVLAAGCSTVGDSLTTSTPTTNLLGLGPTPGMPELDMAAAAEGEELYGLFCASCHKADLSGEPDWMIPNDDGSYPAPPHDSSGHTWHHADSLLFEIVAVGSDFPQSRMPTFGEQLTDDQIDAVLTYLKSTWGPDERAFQWQVTWQDQQLNG